MPATQLVERGTWYGVVEGLSVAWVYSELLAAAIKLRSKLHMRKQTKARPGLFEKAGPKYQIGCKRILFSNNYLPGTGPAQRRPHHPADHRDRSRRGPGPWTERVHEVDVIIWGTGFKATEFLAPDVDQGQ